MRRLAAAAVLVVLSAMAAFGAVQDFGEFTLDIPKGWKAEVKDELVDVILEITKSDKSSSMTFSYSGTGGEVPFTGVDDWLDLYDSPSKVEVTEDGYFTFTFKKEDGKKATLYARRASKARPDLYISVDMSGKDTQTMMAIRDSFALKNAPKRTSGPEPSDSPINEARDDNGNTDLILAAVKGDKKAIEALIEDGADPNIQNKWGMSALMYAAEGNHADTICYLLEAGADLNARNGEGSTALMIAAMHGCEDALETLIFAWADVKIKNNDGKTALDYAMEHKELEDTIAFDELKRLSE